MKFVLGMYAKYNNVKVEVDGKKFDSKKEANRYSELVLLEKHKTIKNLELQPKFLLVEGFEYEGKKERPIYYKADFIYEEGKKKIVEDVKGEKTQVYKLKRKMFLKKYGDEYKFIET
jgi:hypothetical protein